MIIRSLATGRMISKATKENGKYVGKILEETMGKWEIPEDVAQLHLTENEIQQRIEAAVAEHLATTQETEDLNEILRGKLNKLEATDHELRACIEKLQLKCDRLEEENEDLSESIAELEVERQPVEVSAELAGAIEWIKENQRYFETSVSINLTSLWELVFIAADPMHRGELYVTPSKVLKALGNTSDTLRLQIIKRGYTVKPDPLRTRIAAILGNDHEQLDAVIAVAREEESQ